MSHKLHFGLAIDQATNDLYLDATNNLAVATGAQAVAEHVRQRLKTFAGEWFLDTRVGVPWIEDIMGKRYNPAMAEVVFKACVFDTDGVIDITSFSVSFDSDLRNLIIKDVSITTEYDNEEVEI